jgi:hypothetical protein
MHPFLLGFGIPFLVACTFPLAIKTCVARETMPMRWIQNCPPFSVFMLSAFPIAMGIFAVTIFDLQRAGIDLLSVKTYDGSMSILMTSVGALIAMIALAAVIVVHDFASRPVAPYILREPAATQAFKLEKELRDAAKARTVAPRRARGPRHRPISAASNQRKIEDYQKLVQLATPAAIIKQGNFVAAAYLTIGFMGTICCVFYFWFVAVLVISHQTLSKGQISKLLTIFILLITWFPMRVHMDWYQNWFHNPHWLIKSYGFLMGIFLATASLLFIVFITTPDDVALVCAVINALILLFVGFAGKFKPEWLHAVAEALQSLPFVYFLGVYMIFLFVTASIGLRILTG